MSEENCTGSCGSCTADCASRQPSREELLAPANKFSRIKRVIGIVSGKGGVGKSFVTSCMAAAMQKRGYQTAVLDADVTGPSIPKSFGITGKAAGGPQGMVPAISQNGIKVMSVNLLVEKEDTPVVWRGPVVAGVVKQFWSEVFWGEVDYLFVDMPPGTGDVPLTVFQSLPLDGIIIVTSPQDLVSMIVKKAVNMANSMDIPILGLIENYSYMQCSCCGEKLPVFGESQVDSIAAETGLKVLQKLPLDPNLAKKVDAGKVEEISEALFAEAADFVEQVCPADDREEKRSIGRILVAADAEENVAAHFGKCSHFLCFDLENRTVASRKQLDTEVSGNEELAAFITEQQADVLICHGIGFPAMQALMKSGVTVVPGQTGNAEQLVQEYLNGTLE